MCGFVGGTDASFDYAAALTAIAHRGPDAQDLRLVAPVYVGFCRLSIIDLRPTANQPMLAPDGASWIVDLATLTGAVSTALGRGVAGVMGSDSRLVQDVILSGREAGEPIWELPLVDDYVSAMDSPVADLKNTGDGTAGSIFGGLFLREFVGGVPWAHLDIAGVAFTDKPRPCVPRGAVGWGVRTLVGLVERAAAARASKR